MRRLIIEDKAWEDLLYCLQKEPKKLIRIFKLINQVRRTPFSGIGKPEPLKNELKKLWSLRINDVDRLIYKVESDSIIIFSMLGHYN